jgi:hypothetical protein
MCVPVEIQTQRVLHTAGCLHGAKPSPIILGTCLGSGGMTIMCGQLRTLTQKVHGGMQAEVLTIYAVPRLSSGDVSPWFQTQAVLLQFCGT